MSDFGWRYCAHCDEFFWPRNGPSQRYCSASCSAKSQTRAPLRKDANVDPLVAIARACGQFVVGVSMKEGASPDDLAKYVAGYKELSREDRFRVNVLICTQPGVYFDADGDSFRFWPKHRQQQGEAIVRAARFA